MKLDFHGLKLRVKRSYKLIQSNLSNKVSIPLDEIELDFKRDSLQDYETTNNQGGVRCTYCVGIFGFEVKCGFEKGVPQGLVLD